MNETDGQGRITRGLLVIPAATALGLATLYGLGALFKAAELSHAGLSVRDTLPLIPVQQLLTRGIAVVWDSIVGIVLFGCLFLFAFVKVGRVARAETDTPTMKRLRALKSDIAEHGDPDEAVAALKAEEASLAEAFAAVEDDSATQDQLDRVRDWIARAKPALDRAERIRAEIASINVYDDYSPLFVWMYKHERVGYALMFVGLTAACLFSTIPFALGIWLPWITWVAASWSGRRLPWYPHYLWVTVVSLVVAELAAASIAPLPLATVHLRQTDGRRLSGVLIAATADTWYIGERNRRFIAVRAERVTTASIDSSKRKRLKLIFQYF